MAKNTPHTNTAGQTMQPTIHLILQGKGGVGKSLVSSWLAEFLMSRGQPVRCIDGDPVNRSMGQYKAFSADRLDLLNQDGVVERTRYDALIELFLGEDAVYVVDSGATAFLPFWTYLVESDAVELLRQAGRRVFIHIPISAGEMLNDTLLGLRRSPPALRTGFWSCGSTNTSVPSPAMGRRSIRCRFISSIRTKW